MNIISQLNIVINCLVIVFAVCLRIFWTFKVPTKCIASRCKRLNAKYLMYASDYWCVAIFALKKIIIFDIQCDNKQKNLLQSIYPFAQMMKIKNNKNTSRDWRGIPIETAIHSASHVNRQPISHLLNRCIQIGAFNMQTSL